MSGYRYAVGKINAHGIFENLFKNQRHFKDEAYARRVLENNQKFINDELVVQKVHALSPEMALREEIESLKAQLEATKKENESLNNKVIAFEVCDKEWSRLRRFIQQNNLGLAGDCYSDIAVETIETLKKELELERESRSIAIIEEKADAYELFVVDCRHWSLEDLQRMYREKAISHRATVERARARVRERG